MAATEQLRSGVLPPHGLKREAEDDLEGEQRLAKRFNLLNLDHNGKLYIPVHPHQTSPTPQHPLPPPHSPQHQPSPPPPPFRRSRSNAFSDSMHLDESRDRVYIHNLDEELADLSSEDEKLVFLPDIEKRLTKVPRAVLATDFRRKQQQPQNEVVLYGVPSSITVPEEQDNVRKAIIESRERAREHAIEVERARRLEDGGGGGDGGDVQGGTVPFGAEVAQGAEDSDSMDLS